MKTILIVDDEYAISESLIELFEEEGYRVLSAGNGKDGLERLRKESPDLVLLDNMMPIMDGKEFLRRLRAMPEHCSTPVVMMSAAPKHVALWNGPGGPLEVSEFLAKPFLLNRLLDVIERLIGKGDSQDAEASGHERH